jgi:hypothetical protein
MESKIIELLSEEIRETRNLTLAIRAETEVLREEVKESKRKADAAWELVIMTREEMKKSLWKKLFG